MIMLIGVSPCGHVGESIKAWDSLGIPANPLRPSKAASQPPPAAQTRSRSPLLLKVVDEADLYPLLPLDNNNVAAVPPLPVHGLETPDLARDPAVVDALGDRQHVRLALGADLFAVVLEPVALEEVVVDVVGAEEARAAAHLAVHPVLVLAVHKVEAALLGRARQARGGLDDVDARHLGAVLGRGREGRVLVLRYVEVDGGQGDGLADEPADALEGEDGLGAVGERLVLAAVLAGGYSPS